MIEQPQPDRLHELSQGSKVKLSVGKDFWADEDEVKNNSILNEAASFIAERVDPGTQSRHLANIPRVESWNPNKANDEQTAEYSYQLKDKHASVSRPLRGQSNRTLPQVRVSAKFAGPRLLKMADYFAEDTTSQQAQAGFPVGERPVPFAAQLKNTQLANATLVEQVKLIEQEILQNVDINFLFAKGGDLRSSLIDLNRIYLVVDRIKVLARQQAEEGSKDINYQELVAYIQQLDGNNQRVIAASADPQEHQN